MREIVYSVAMSLDGYIAGSSGDYGWIPEEKGIDWTRFLSRFDTVIMGRKTFEVTMGQPSTTLFQDKTVYVVSRTLSAGLHPAVRVVREDPGPWAQKLRGGEGRDIWLMGGGELFGALLEAGAVNRVEVAVVPILLGGGIPLLPTGTARTLLTLAEVERYPSGIMLLSYRVGEGGKTA